MDAGRINAAKMPRRSHLFRAWSKIKRSTGRAARTAAFLVALPLLSSLGCGGAEVRPQPLSVPDTPANIEKGHKAPKFTFKTLGAAHLAVEQLRKNEGMFESDIRTPEYISFIKMNTVGLQTRIFDRSASISRDWLTEDYLGSVVYQRFAKSPSIAVYDVMDNSEGEYILGTNIITINPHADFSHTYTACIHEVIIRTAFEDLIESEHWAPTWTDVTELGMDWCELPQVEEADLRSTIAHESLHYVSFLGGGWSLGLETSSGEYETQQIRGDFHEGLTELHTQQLVRKKGYTPSKVAYHIPTTIAFFLQKLVGEETLREAYFNGDFSDVRTKTNNRLGDGTFERLFTEVPNSLFLYNNESLFFFTNRMKNAGINYCDWTRDNDIIEAIKTGPRFERDRPAAMDCSSF